MRINGPLTIKIVLAPQKMSKRLTKKKKTKKQSMQNICLILLGENIEKMFSDVFSLLKKNL